MKNSILKLGKALKKEDQKEINGGLSISSFFCESVCKTAARGTRCYSPISWESVCDGRGGFIPL